MWILSRYLHSYKLILGYVMKVLNEDFVIHDTLNPKLFDTTTKKLRPEVRKKLVEIVSEFEKYIEVPIAICDVQLVGSNCSYNYTENSDLDVHVIANFSVLEIPKEVLQNIYNTIKTNFNKSFDITIRGIEIEMFIQDINSTTVSNGIYSLCDDEWIKEPQPIKSATKHNTEKEVEKWTAKINSILANPSYEEVLEAINVLYLIRHNSIATDGERGKGNQIFKDIRSLGLLQKLKDELKKQISKRLTLEDLTYGKLVNSVELDK